MPVWQGHLPVNRLCADLQPLGWPLHQAQRPSVQLQPDIYHPTANRAHLRMAGLVGTSAGAPSATSAAP